MEKKNIIIKMNNDHKKALVTWTDSETNEKVEQEFDVNEEEFKNILVDALEEKRILERTEVEENSNSELENKQEVVEDTNDIDLDSVPFTEDEDIEDHIIIEEHQAKNKKFKATALAYIGAVVGILAICGIATCNKCDNKDLENEITVSVIKEAHNEEKEEKSNADDSDNTKDVPDDNAKEELPPMSLEELQSDSRYTEVSEELLTETTQRFMIELSKHNIELDGNDALTFVTVANLTHMAQTNQELLSSVITSFDDVESTLSKVGHIIGQIVVLEVTNKDEQVDWTVAFMNETDKDIAKHGLKTIEMCKEIAANEELTDEEKTTQIQSTIQERFVKPNYDKTEGYDFERNQSSGNIERKSQEDGADFITDAIFTGIVLGDNVIKNYVYGSETMDDMIAISGNEDVVSNIMTILSDCQMTR